MTKHREVASKPDTTEARDGWRWSAWRIAGWSFVAIVLLLPAVAMQFSAEVNWSLSDFIVAGVLLVGTGLSFELAVRKVDGMAYRAGAALALVAALLLTWINGAVGIIGSEDNPANLMFVGVLAVGFVGVFLARFRPSGMARALVATAFAQTLVAVIAIVANLGAPYTGVVETVWLNGFFVILFAASALLFRRAAQSTSNG